MGGIDKLDAVIARARPSWPGRRGRDGPRRSSSASIVVVSPERVDDVAGRAWLRELGCAVVAGGVRRQDSVAAGVAATDGGRRPGPRRGPAARRLLSVVIAVAEAADRSAARPSRCCRSSIAQARRRRPHRRGRRSGRPWSARRRRRAPAASSSSAALEASADGPPAFGDEAELLARDGVPVVTVPGEAANLKVTAVRPTWSSCDALAGARRRSPRSATGTDSHPFGPGDGLRLGGIDLPRPPAPARPLRRRRRAPRHLRRAARRPPASATSAACSRPATRRRAASTARELLREVVDATRRRRAGAAQVDRLRSAAPGPASGGARSTAMRTPSRELIGPRPPSASRSRPRPATSRATRAPAGPSPPTASSRWSRSMTPALPQHARRRARAVRAARARARAHVHLRPDRLRALPRRQLPELPVRRPPAPLPGWSGLPRDVGHEHHRRRRQDHPRRGRRRASPSGS